MLSQQSQLFCFYFDSLQCRSTAICSFVCLKFSTLALLKAFIVKTSFSLSLKSAVKTIMSNISRGRLPSHWPRGCRYRYGYCGHFPILFYRHFQNLNNTLYFLSLIPKIIVTCLSSRLLGSWKERQHRLLPPLYVETFTWEQICHCADTCTFKWQWTWFYWGFHMTSLKFKLQN